MTHVDLIEKLLKYAYLLRATLQLLGAMYGH